MVQAAINGRVSQFAPGTTVLDAVRSMGVDLPALCDDARLKPCGSCRLCLVEINSSDHPAAACVTTLADGMEVRTHTPQLERNRETLLRLLAARYPAEAASTDPERPLHRWLKHYRIEPSGLCTSAAIDDSHPYIRVDMSRCILCYRCVRICGEVQGEFVWRVQNRSDHTSIAADGGVPFGLSRCVSCGACADTCPTGALADKQPMQAEQPLTFIRTTCPYCGAGCELDAGVSDGRLVSVRPALDGPASRGHLCSKGRYAFDYVYAPDRILHPMIRSDSGWLQATWEEAIAFAASRLEWIRGHYGPGAIGMLGSARATNEDNYLAQKFARVVLGTNNVDSCARVCHAPTAAAMSEMLGAGAATNSYDDIERAGAILVYGANPTENHPSVGARIQQAVSRGTPLIVVDPRRTALAARATIHLAVRPGTDIALLNALAHTVVFEGLADRDFISTRAAGFEEFEKFIDEWTPERASSICGVDASQIREAARLYAAGRPSMCIHGLGITEHTQGTDGVMCLVNLALLTGNFGKPGSGVNPLRGQNNVQGAAHMGCDPDRLAGYATLLAGREEFERVWRAKLPTESGRNLLEMLDAAAEGKLRALWVMGYDILPTTSHAWKTLQALSNLELVIVQDLFLNDTAQAVGTVFFPAASSFEKDGTFMNAERRLQPVRKAITTSGKARPDWEIFCAVAEAMGHGAGFAFSSAEEVWNEIRAVWPAGAGITYRRLEHGGLQWPCPSEDHPGTPILHQDAFASETRARFQSIEWLPSPEAASKPFPLTLITGRTLFQFNCGNMSNRTPNTFFRATDTLDISPQDAAAYQVTDGDMIRLVSRYGSTELPVRITEAMRPGEIFATFHSRDVFLNAVTGPHRDAVTSTPEYKVTAVRLERV